jgi:hypothetical protein
MTQEDIISMAREANRYASHQTSDSFEWQEIRDERFAALVAASEREACAKVCEDASKPREGEMHSDAQWAGLVLSAAIRARSNA